MFYKKGDIINNCTFINYTKLNKHNHKLGVFKCICGTLWETSISSLKSKQTNSCGCLRKTHGMTKHPLYTKHNMMLHRCYNIENPDYYSYGKRNIGVEEFLRDVRNYIEYIESLPNAYKEDYTIDRIDNDGNYERGNLRWASNAIQAANKSNNLKYVGVYLHKDGKYIVKLTHKKKSYFIGYFKTEKEAVEARNAFIIKNNFPHQIQTYK